MENISSDEKFPEIALQKELLENFEYKESGRRWYWPVVADGTPLDTAQKAELLLSQKAELPFLVSGLLERTCNLQCTHCLYQKEKSSKDVSREAHLAETIEHMVHEMPHQQMDESEEDFYPYGPSFMSCGRILRPWHLDIFQKLREDRPDVALGVIDNGTYTQLLSKWPEGFKFDWIDISLDGTEEHHNEQRGSPLAYTQAIEGLKHAREIVKPRTEGGKVASLFTLTKINAEDIEQVADTLLSKNEDDISLADEFNITTLSPTNETNTPLETDVESFANAWEGLKKINEKYPPTQDEEGKISRSIFLRVYRVEDMEKIASVVGERKFMEALSVDESNPEKSTVRVVRNNIEFDVDGIHVVYLPLSIWTPEELLIEADGAYRTAYEGKYTLDELRSGHSKDGNDTAPYTIEKLSLETDFKKAYEHGVDHWWENFGNKKLDQEMETFQRIREKAKEYG